jgi:RHS repeat-associated protein
VGLVDGDGRRQHRALDPAGNVYLRDDMSDRRYGPGNRLESAEGTTFQYDPDGWIVARQGAAGRWDYKWNGAGLLQQADGPDGRRVAFEYDAFARRVRKVSWLRPGAQTEPDDEVRYVWDGNRLLHEASPRRGLVTWYWDGDGLTPVAKEANGQQWTIASDHLGTPTVMYDRRGAVVWKARLGPTGLLALEVGAADDCPWRWRGQYEDRETGLYYNRHRYYDPALGRYLSPDPSGLAGGLNAYAYVDDPVVQVDPFGLHVIEAFLDGVSVVNPKARSHPTWWRNLTGSGDNGMAASGFGRLNDSENRLMEHLQQVYGKDGLKGKTLEIRSLGEPGMGWGALDPCDHCHPGMQNFANEMEMTVIYHGPEGKEPRRYEPCSK